MQVQILLSRIPLVAGTMPTACLIASRSSVGWAVGFIHAKGIEMLVLTRKVEESIVVGDDVRITVLSIKGDRVRIGVEAPRTTPVHRLEVYTRNQEASS